MKLKRFLILGVATTALISGGSILSNSHLVETVMAKTNHKPKTKYKNQSQKYRPKIKHTNLVLDYKSMDL